jgi:hypothetical protein
MTAINTHELFKQLVATGLTDGASEVISTAILNSRIIGNFATKEQVDILEKEQSDIKTDLVIIKTDIANIKQTMATRADLMELKIDLLKWIVPMFITIMGAIIALLVKII